MKYINRREDFLKNYNNILKIKDKYTNSENIKTINEDVVGGPFVNNVGWGDSLLGRLINSTLRKAKIGANLLRIKSVEQRLRDSMDDILLTSSVAELDENDKRLYAKALISTYLIALQDAVEKGEAKIELLNLTESAILEVNSNKDLEDKNELLRQLNEWKKYLEQFEEGESEDDDYKNEEKRTETETYLENFKYLFDILLTYQGITQEIKNVVNSTESPTQQTNKQSSTEGEFEIGKEYVFTNKSGKENPVKIISLDKTKKAGPDKEFLTKDDIIGTDVIKRDHAFVAFKDVKGMYKKTMSVPKNQLKPLPGEENVTVAKSKEKTPKQIQTESKLMKYDDFLKIDEDTNDTNTSKVGKPIGKIVGKIWKFITSSKDERKLDLDTKKLWDVIKPLYLAFKSEPNILIKDGEFHKFLNSDDRTTNDGYEKYKLSIDKIYTNIRSINGINEDVHTILEKSNEIGKYIADIYTVTKEKPDGSFIIYIDETNKIEVKGETWDVFTDDIKGFNESMKYVLEVTSKWNEGDTVTWNSRDTGKKITKEILRIDGRNLIFKDKSGKEFTKSMDDVEKVLEESKTLLRYKSFLSMNEADYTENKIGFKKEEDTTDPTEDTEDPTEDTTNDNNSEVSEWKNPNSVTKIQDWWDKKMDLKIWILEKTEVDKVRVNLDKKLAEKKDSIVIDGMDPILEIVKVFNRAYKLHTTQVIPTGRSGGKVSNKTFLEYHSFGGGTPETAGASGGPYRNNAIFNQWENCVLDVKKDKKYQAIFNVGTKLKVGDEYIEKAGMNLRKFMTDMLDGDELYKGGSGKEQGAQAKFLDKYFGYKDDKNDSNLYYGGDGGVVTGVANNIKSVEVSLVDGRETSIKIKNENSLEYTWFSLLISENGGNGKRFYFQIQEIKDNFLYINYSETAFYLKKSLQKFSRTTVNLNKEINQFNEKDPNGEIYPIMATRIKSTELYKDGKFNLPNSITINSVMRVNDDKKSDNKGTKVVKKENNWKIIKANHIVDLSRGSTKDDFKRVKIDKSSTEKNIKEYGGFENISSTEGIKDTNIK